VPRRSPSCRLAAVAVIALALASGAPQYSRAESSPDTVDVEFLADEHTGTFDERFSGEREIPIFTRPEIVALIFGLPPLTGDPAGVIGAAEPDPSQPASVHGVAAADADDKSALQVVKELLISPAQGAEPPAVSNAEAASAPSAPREDEPVAVAGVAPSPDDARRTAQPIAHSQGEQAAADRQALARDQGVSEKPAQPPRRIAAGQASYYEHPGRTASGEKYDPGKLTAAHKNLPFGTRVRVVNRENGRSAVVRINDRAPRAMPFVIDLSRGSARALGITEKDGIAPVAVYKAD
jgi:rare lipoprotein A